jgi:hypothetical protein
MSKQKEAVYTTTMNVLNDMTIQFDGNANAVVTDEARAAIHSILCAGFTDGNIPFSTKPSNADKLANPIKLSSYVSGLISNWYKKDVRLNGGVKFSRPAKAEASVAQLLDEAISANQ